MYFIFYIFYMRNTPLPQAHKKNQISTQFNYARKTRHSKDAAATKPIIAVLENSRADAPLPGVAAPPADGVLLLLLPLPAALPLTLAADADRLARMELRADVSAGALDVADASADEGLSVAAAPAAAAEVAAVASDAKFSCLSVFRAAVVAFGDAGALEAGRVAEAISVGKGPVWRFPFSPSGSW